MVGLAGPREALMVATEPLAGHPLSRCLGGVELVQAPEMPQIARVAVGVHAVRRGAAWRVLAERAGTRRTGQFPGRGIGGGPFRQWQAPHARGGRDVGQERPPVVRRRLTDGASVASRSASRSTSWSWCSAASLVRIGA